MGEAHEVFTDCVDDIQGAVNLAKQKGAKEIYPNWTFNWLSEIYLLS